jgi:hypothetical protein
MMPNGHVYTWDVPLSNNNNNNNNNNNKFSVTTQGRISLVIQGVQLGVVRACHNFPHYALWAANPQPSGVWPPTGRILYLIVWTPA